MCLTGRPVTLSGLGKYLPETIVTNDDLSKTLDTSDEWIQQRTGIRERRIAMPGLSASDLGIPAAQAALRDAQLSPKDVDLVITATISPDQIMPATSSRIAHEAGCINAGAFDVSAGCTGFVYALATAAGTVSSGLHDHVLVVGAEAISRIIDQSDRSTAILFGDGAGAVVVSALDSKNIDNKGASSAIVSASKGPQEAKTDSVSVKPRGILGFDLGNDGSGGPFLNVPAGGSRFPASHETVDEHLHFMHMQGNEVYKFATRIVSVSARRILERCGMKVQDIDLFVPHQASMRIINSAATKLGLAKEKIYTNLQRYGNTSCASIPLCLSEARAEGRLKPGDLVLLMGFGAGLTWGACLMEWGLAATDVVF